MTDWTTHAVTAEQLGVLLGLSLFFGFAFEGFYATDVPDRPGGVRTFPLLSFAGALLYVIEPHFALAFVAGLGVLGSWLFGYVRANLKIKEGHVESHFVIPTAIILAYLLGPIVLTQPLWLAVGVTVIAVILIGSRNALHTLVQRVPREEVLTAGTFLLLVGVVLPLLYGAPAIPATTITPFKVWLAVVAVSTLSYATYLVQRYLFPERGLLLTALLGGLYSSTATTVVLARKAFDQGMSADVAAGIVAATGMMYARIVIVCAIFNLELARRLAIPLLALAVVTMLAAVLLDRTGPHTTEKTIEARNPLQLTTAFVFALLLIAISVLSTWVEQHLGGNGVIALAAVVGFTDIDPFVLSLAQGGVATIGMASAAAAIVIATSSNNLLKALYALLFSRRREAWVPALILVGASALGVVVALVVK